MAGRLAVGTYMKSRPHCSAGLSMFWLLRWRLGKASWTRRNDGRDGSGSIT